MNYLLIENQKYLRYIYNYDCDVIEFYRIHQINCGMDYAVKNGHLEITKYMHSTGKKYTTNVINQAAICGYLEIVKYFDQIHESCIGRDKASEICMAAFNGNLEVVKYLVKNMLVTLNDKYNMFDVINQAAVWGYLNIVKYLYGVYLKNPEICTINNDVCYNKFTIMDIAAGGGSLELVKYLHEFGECYTKRGIVWAILNGHLEVVKYLMPIKKGYISMMDNYVNMIHCRYIMEIAAAGNYPEIVKYLHYIGEECPASVVDYFIKHNNPEVIDYLSTK